MALHGEDLGAELANLWHDGTKVLPKVAGDYHTAWLNTPISISGYTTRGGGLGTDPGSAFDAVLNHLNNVTSHTEKVLDGVGQALVWTANIYAETDAAAKATFDAQMNQL